MLRLLRPKASPAHAVSRQRQTQDPLAANGIELFEALVSEAHGATVRTAAVTSFVNALGSKQRLASPQSLKAVLPQQPGVLDALPRCQQELRLPGKSLAAVVQFYESLGYAHAGIVSFCDDAEAWGTGQAAFLHCKTLSSVWRRLSCLALGAVTGLDPQVERCLPDRYGQNTRILKELLTEVVRGGWPCLDASGNPTIPDLPQRRPAARRTVIAPCIVEHEGKTARAVVKDISASGLGLEHVPALTPQKVAIVEFDGGRCLACVVVWVKDSRAGLKFHVPLDPADPLLAN